MINQDPGDPNPQINLKNDVNDQIRSMDRQNNPVRIYDIRERTLQFGIRIIRISQDIPTIAIFSSIRSQIVRSGTSIGANIAEGDGAKTKRDFVNKLVLSRKEAKETKYWLRLINGLNLDKLQLDDDISEVQEIINVLSSIINKTGKSKS